MSSAALLTALVGSSMALMLSGSALRNHALGRNQMLRMALIWAAIIAAVTLIISQVRL